METLKEQKLIYLTRRKADVVKLKYSISQKDFEFAKILGHRLKGHGETFGFPIISKIGEQLEKAAFEKNLFVLEETIQKFESNVEENLAIVQNK